MCDYSLAHLPNRLAVDGEDLVVHRFGYSHGLTPTHRNWKEILFPGIRTAVCVPPGAQLRLRDLPEHLQRQLGIGSTELVTFTQQSVEAFRHRDAVRFANRQEILLQQLPCGQRVEVVSVACAEEQVAQPESKGITWPAQAQIQAGG
jgi:hypothetical protein